MKNRGLLILLPFLSLAPSLWAQDAHSLGIGFAATAAPMGIFGVYWNASQMGAPDGSKSGWSIATGFSAFDTTNTGLPVIHFTPDQALQISQDPIQRFQEYFGVFSTRYKQIAGDVIFDQNLTYTASQGALQFFHDRNAGTIGVGSAYNLNFQQTNQQVGDLVVSYGTPIPLGNIQLFTVGGSLKYHDGLQYEQTVLNGTYSQSAPGSGYTYTKTTSSSGLGLSLDLGFLAQLSNILQVGMMFQNVQSSFTWQATQQTYQLDGAGAETPVGPSTSVNVSTPYPYATKLGAAFTKQDSNITLEGQVSWSQGQTRWSGGLERFYPDANIMVRFGTFADDISNQQIWCFGAGYMASNLAIDVSFLTRSIPDLQNSITLGGGIDAVVLF